VVQPAKLEFVSNLRTAWIGDLESELLAKAARLAGKQRTDPAS
jgi:hypothetical protein